MELNKLYKSTSFQYQCELESALVHLVALWYLGTDQGTDFLMAKSSRVICDNAKGCRSLEKKECPLTSGYGDELNNLNVVVMRGETPVSVSFKGEKLFALAAGGLKSGQFVWFGKTDVFSPDE